MTSSEFVSSYIMHDSLIDKVEVLDDGSTIVLWIDFAFWMQNGYKDTEPETGTLKVFFHNVKGYSIPKDADWNEISILETVVDGDAVKFNLMNDMTDDYLEIIISAESITATEVFDR